jgi:hypothetical protein
MSSMPPPIATAGRGTRGRADTTWQSVIDTQSAVRTGPLSTWNWPFGQKVSTWCRQLSLLATRRVTDYHRSSMARGATNHGAIPALGPVGAPRPISFVAPKRR